MFKHYDSVPSVLNTVVSSIRSHVVLQTVVVSFHKERHTFWCAADDTAHVLLIIIMTMTGAWYC